MQDLLEYKGYNVIGFDSAEKLLEKIDSIAANLFLLDHQLPGIDGLELLPMIKEKYPSLPVALVTASCQKDTFDTAMNRGAERIIHKPYEQTEVLSAVEEMLSRESV